jgi:tetratricopeptide (TPR) repeat protein
MDAPPSAASAAPVTRRSSVAFIPYPFALFVSGASFFWKSPRRLFALAGLALVVVAAAAGGVMVWAEYQFRAAQRELRADHLPEARRHIQLCLYVWRYSPDAHFLAARIARSSAKYEEAEFHLNESTRLQRNVTAQTQTEWFMLRAQRGDFRGEVENGLWNCVLHDDPETSMILEAMARVYMLETRFRPALVCLTKWLEREPDTVRALDWRGWVFEKMESRQPALDDYRRVLELDPDRDEVRIRLANMLVDDSNALDALPHWERLQQTQPNRVEVSVGLARCRILQGRSEEGRELLDQVLASQPDNPTALLLRANLELQQGRPAEAEHYLRRALTVDPYLLGAIFSLGKCLDEQGGHETEVAALQDRFEQQKRDLQRITQLMNGQIEREPHNPDSPSELGILLLRVGQVQVGIHWLYTALERDPDHKPTHEALIAYFEKTNQPEKAKEHRLRLAEIERMSSSSSP